MYYLVIDLEMCNVPKHYRTSGYSFATETIQIGAVLLDEDYRQIDTMSCFVHPQYGVLDNYISDLTGIQNRDLVRAPTLQEALHALLDWIGDREYLVFEWSDSDRAQLRREVRAKQINDAHICSFLAEDRWVDYQAEFMDMFGFTRRIGLEEALDRAEITAKGRMHDGLADAINTAALITKLECNPDYELSGYALRQDAEKPLACTLGDLWPTLRYA